MSRNSLPHLQAEEYVNNASMGPIGGLVAQCPYWLRLVLRSQNTLLSESSAGDMLAAYLFFLARHDRQVVCSVHYVYT